MRKFPAVQLGQISTPCWRAGNVKLTSKKHSVAGQVLKILIRLPLSRYSTPESEGARSGFPKLLLMTNNEAQVHL